MQNPPEDGLTIEDLITRTGRSVFDEPVMCTGWVLVCEWSNGSKYWTSTEVDEQNPLWRHMGLLQWAAENIGTEYVEDEEDEDEEEFE